MSETVMSREVPEFCRQVLNRWRELALIRSCGSVLIAGCLLTAVWLAADALLDLPSWLRGLGLAAVILTVVTMIVRGLWRALRPVPLTRVAAIIEAADPAWQERLLAVIDDSATMKQDSPTVRACCRQLQRELKPLIASHTPHDVLDGRQAVTRFALGMVAVVALIAPCVWAPAGMQLLWHRLVQPQKSIAWGWSYRLDPLDPVRIAVRGTDVPVRVVASPLFFASPQPPELWLNWTPAGDSTAIERRLAWSEEDRAYIGHVVQPTASFAWEVVCRGGRSAPQQTQVVPAPVLRDFQLTSDPPSYTGLPSNRYRNPVESVAVSQGTRLHWQLLWSEPLASLTLQFRAPIREEVQIVGQSLAEQRPDGHTSTATWFADQFAQVVAVLATKQGLVVEMPLGQVAVIADRPPQFSIADRLSRSVSATETVTVAASVLDDHGLTSIEWHLEPATGDKQVRNVLLDRNAPTRFESQATIDLTEFGLEPGQMLKARLRASDNAPTPHVAWSDPLTFIARYSNPDDELHKLARQSDEARDELKKIRSELNSIQQQLRDVHRRTAAATVKQRTAEESAALAQLTQREAHLRERLQAWANERGGSDWMAESAQAAREIADGDLQDAQELLEAAEKSEPRPQIEQLSQCLDELAAADRQLDRLDGQLAKLGQKGTPLQELVDLADRAEQLARQLENPPGDVNLDEPTQQLSQDLDDWLEQHPDFAAAVTEAQLAELRRIGQRAGQLAEEEQQVATAIDPQRDGAVSADQPSNGDESNVDPAVDAERPRNRPQSGNEEFQAGEQLADQLREASEQSTELARELLEKFGPDAPPVEAAVAAARAANEAQEQLEQGQPQSSSQCSKKAAGQSQQAADALGGSAAGKQAAQLAKSFQSAAEQLDAQSSSAEFQRGGLASTQERIAADAEQLAQLANQTGLLDGNKTASEPQQLGQQMSQALQQAEDSLAESREALAASQTDAAQAAAVEAQAALESAARLAPTAGKPSSVPRSAGDALQQARENLQQAQQAQQQPPSEQQSSAACTACRNAGKSLRQAAQGKPSANSSAGTPVAKAGSKAQPGGNTPNQGGVAEATRLDVLNSEVAKQSQRVWGRLPGKLRTEIFQGSQQSAHPEYANQIQRYFERIAQSPSESATNQNAPVK